MNLFWAANLALRGGVAFAFLYPPYAALMDPTGWLGYFPHFVLTTAASMGIPELVVLHGFGILEVIIALWLISGYKVYYPAAAAVLMLAAIVVLDLRDFEVLFRDVSIALAAGALALGEYARAHYTV